LPEQPPEACLDRVCGVDGCCGVTTGGGPSPISSKSDAYTKSVCATNNERRAAVLPKILGPRLDPETVRCPPRYPSLAKTAPGRVRPSSSRRSNALSVAAFVAFQIWDLPGGAFGAQNAAFADLCRSPAKQQHSNAAKSPTASGRGDANTRVARSALKRL
jgi:hypothetical protein